MNNGSKVTSWVLAALAGVCFVAGVTLLSDEGSDVNHGTSEETASDF